MLADIVILSNDIFESRPDALRDTEVTVTIFDGKIVYQRPPPVKFERLSGPARAGQHVHGDQNHLRDAWWRRARRSSPRSSTKPSPTPRRRSAANISSTSTASSSKPTEQFDDRSPIDTSILLGRFQQGTRDHVRAAVAAARAAYPAWAALSWQQRLVHVRKIADAIRDASIASCRR